jgi:putative endonuclease
MLTQKRQYGNAAEDLAADYLKQNGYKIIERNYACKTGEIDIIAQKGGCLVFAEVKARSTQAFGGPVGAVTAAKQKRVANTAMCYIKEKKPKFDSLMFDIIAVLDGKAQHIQNAFVPNNFTL